MTYSLDHTSVNFSLIFFISLSYSILSHNTNFLVMYNQPIHQVSLFRILYFSFVVVLFDSSLYLCIFNNIIKHSFSFLKYKYMFSILFLIILIPEFFTLSPLFPLAFPHGILVPYVFHYYFFNVSCSFFLSSYLWKVLDTWDIDGTKLLLCSCQRPESSNENWLL